MPPRAGSISSYWYAPPGPNAPPISPLLSDVMPTCTSNIRPIDELVVCRWSKSKVLGTDQPLNQLRQKDAMSSLAWHLAGTIYVAPNACSWHKAGCQRSTPSVDLHAVSYYGKNPPSPPYISKTGSYTSGESPSYNIFMPSFPHRCGRLNGLTGILWQGWPLENQVHHKHLVSIFYGALQDWHPSYGHLAYHNVLLSTSLHFPL